jgi:hypothetical protein
MSRVHPCSRRVVPRFTVLVLTLPLVGLAAPEGKSQPDGATPKERSAKPAVDALVDVNFTDDGHIKVRLREEKIELVTPYGKLLIPAADIRRIEFATRVPDDVVKRIDAAIVNLAREDFKTRETATAELAALGPAAYPALLKAANSPDAEVKRRAEELVTKLTQEVSADRLEVKPYDIIHTDTSKIAGRISGSTLKVTTAQFGEQQMKLSDIRSLHVPGAGPEAATDTAAVDTRPDSLMQIQHNIGKTYRFRVTGNVNGIVWGSDVYTTDSSLETAAVHAGVLKSGQTGVVKVTFLPPPATFGGTTRNGVTTSPYLNFPGAFKVSK